MKNLILTLILVLIVLATNATSQTTNNSGLFNNGNNQIQNNAVYLGSVNYNFTDKLTIGVWVKWNVDPVAYSSASTKHEWANIITCDNNNYPAWDQGQFWVQHSQTNKFFEFAVKTSFSGASNRQYFYSKTQPVANKWYYITAVYNGSADTTVKFYINGVLETFGLQSVIAGNIFTYSSNNRLTIGKIPAGYRLFNGNIDELRLWKRALTQDEIINQMYSKQTVNSIGLASYWDFDTPQGPDLLDKGPQGANGKFYKELIELYSFSKVNGQLIGVDSIKIWTPNSFAGSKVKVISGNGVDSSYTIVSNTANSFVLSAMPTWVPTLVNVSFMTVFGVEAGATDNAMWNTSNAPVGYTALSNLSELRGVWNMGALNTSSILKLYGTNIANEENVVFGHDTSSMTFDGNDLPSGINSRLTRSWKFQTNKSGNLVGSISFRISDLNVPVAANLRLIVSNSSTMANGTVYTGVATDTTFIVTSIDLATGTYITLGSLDGPLPVEMASFTAQVTGNIVNLKWTTANEVNNSGFDVERSDNGTSNWIKTGFVKGNGTINKPTSYSYSDTKLQKGNYSYRLKQVDFNGNFEYHKLLNSVTVSSPAKYSLEQNYPNPFNPSTKISFQLPNDSKVSLKVYDISGKEITTLVNDFKTAGYYTVEFNAANLASGVYFYNIHAGDYSKVMKMVVVK